MTAAAARAEGRFGLAKVHSAALLFGFAGLFGKLVDLPSALIVLGRVAFAVPTLAIAAALSRESLRPRSGREALALAAPGLLLALHWTAFFEAVRVSTVAIALIAFATFPVLVVFLEAPVFKRRIGAGSVASAIAVVLGAWLSVPTVGPGGGSTAGALWGLAAAASFALLTVINERSVGSRPGVVVAFWQDSAAAVALAALAPALAAGVTSVPSRDLLMLAILGVPCTAVAHTLYIGGLRTVPSRTASLIASLEPVYGILFALVLLGEVPAARTLAGGAVILAAAAYASLRAPRK